MAADLMSRSGRAMRVLFAAVLIFFGFAASGPGGEPAVDSVKDSREPGRFTIGILPYEGVSEELVEPLLPRLEETFGLPFSIIDAGRALPDGAYDGERGQYDASAVLRDVVEAKPKRAARSRRSARIIGVVREDVYVGNWNFIFGLASPENAAAVVSVHRLLTDDEEKFGRRLLTEIVHELGHTFGLYHCGARRCAMRFSIHIGQVDGKGPALCRACRRKLQKAVKALEK